jgi:hypothetical protein
MPDNCADVRPDGVPEYLYRTARPSEAPAPSCIRSGWHPSELFTYPELGGLEDAMEKRVRSPERGSWLDWWQGPGGKDWRHEHGVRSLDLSADLLPPELAPDHPRWRLDGESLADWTARTETS